MKDFPEGWAWNEETKNWYYMTATKSDGAYEIPSDVLVAAETIGDWLAEHNISKCSMGPLAIKRVI